MYVCMTRFVDSREIQNYKFMYLNVHDCSCILPYAFLFFCKWWPSRVIQWDWLSLVLDNGHEKWSPYFDYKIWIWTTPNNYASSNSKSSIKPLLDGRVMVLPSHALHCIVTLFYIIFNLLCCMFIFLPLFLDFHIWNHLLNYYRFILKSQEYW